jgi:4-amino-4-deoxy-L-arabinose transferase-like glycosyltransferase
MSPKPKRSVNIIAKITMNAWLRIILFISALIKCIGLNQSLWLDEAITANVVSKYSIRDIITHFTPSDFHPPFYYIFMRLWTRIFGISEIALRIPSVIFSLITVYIVYLIVKKINIKAALWASALVAFNPLLIYYAQETRMYAMTTMFISLAILAKVNKNKWQMYLWSFLSFCTFYGSVFILFALDIFNWGLYGAALILLPLIIKQYTMSKVFLGDVVNWNLTLGTINIKNLFLIFIKMITGRIPFIKIYILPTILIWWVGIRSGFKNKYFLRLLFLPLLLGFMFSIKIPMMQYFRFQYLIIPLSILLALKYKNSILFLFIFILFSIMYVFDSNNYREDWKTLSTNLPKDTPIYMIGSFADPINYYRKDIKIIDIKQIQPTEKEIIYLPYGEEIHGLEHNKIFENIGYKKTKEISFREISFEHWQK